MWALGLCGIAAGALLARWRQSGLKRFDFFERQAMRLFARLWHRCTSTGPDPLPVTGPAILVANHPTQADPAFLIASCKRPPCFLQAQEYYHVFLLRHLFDRAGCIPVGRDGREVSGVRRALRCLREGSILGIFLEGDLTSVCQAQHGGAKGGAALLALRARVPVFPAYIAGGPQGRPLLQAWLWPSRGVRVIYGSPVDLSGYRHRRLNRQLIHEVTALLMERIEALRPVASKKESEVVSFSRHEQTSLKRKTSPGADKVWTRDRTLGALTAAEILSFSPDVFRLLANARTKP